jgi:N,N'-diacetyllegionaminate synthase
VSFCSHVEIAGRRIGPGEPTFVIAEAGVNHFGSIEKAFALVDMAIDAGADALKLQHFDTDTTIGPSAQEWRDRLRSKQLSDDDILRIRDRCDQNGIIFLCTAHDAKALKFLHEVADVPAFKVGSGEVSNWPWLKEIADFGKPMIVSTGMYTLDDVEDALKAISNGGNDQLALLHCITAYPADPASINLAVMEQLRSLLNGPVGYSDHTAGTAVPLAAVALGADVIEKHITIDRDVPNAQDWKVSCDPSNFAKFVSDIREVSAARGGSGKTLNVTEQASLLWARKSLTAVRDLASGHVLRPEDLVAMRPGSGMPPKDLDRVVGRALQRPLAAGEVLTVDAVGLSGS